ncbi:12765_t:CDS:2 [Acaulospora colombiana]|uniref:12765_t:CDS:1 n=1 Tax=Acaulospora colombiana TaxID=27376 RepID=A0ACA9JVU2_9GLOM|nr:12765_t:CDS:2 [Acaulospora colombiana]
MRLTLLIGKNYRTYKRYLNNNKPDTVMEEKLVRMIGAINNNGERIDNPPINRHNISNTHIQQ